MRSFAFDLYDALRGLRRDRIFAALVVVTLALTIGATTAVFSIVNGVLLRPLAYDDPERLVTFQRAGASLRIECRPCPSTNATSNTGAATHDPSRPWRSTYRFRPT